MDENSSSYLDCRGLQRLVLHVLAKTSPIEGKAGGYDLNDLIDRCQAELGRSVASAPSTEGIALAIEEAQQRGWIDKIDERYTLAEDNGAIALFAKSADVEAGTAALATLRILVALKSSAQYEFDPRVNSDGEITRRELSMWAVMQGLSAEAIRDGFAMLLRERLISICPIGPISDLNLVAVTDEALEALQGTGREALEKRIDRISKEFRTSTPAAPSPHFDSILHLLGNAEMRLDERIERLPNEQLRSEALSLIDQFDWPRQGLTLDELEAYFEKTFPGCKLGKLAPEWEDCSVAAARDDPRYRFKKTDFVKYLHQDMPDLTDFAISRAFDVCQPTPGRFPDTVLALRSDGRIRFSELREVRASDECSEATPTFRLFLRLCAIREESPQPRDVGTALTERAKRRPSPVDAGTEEGNAQPARHTTNDDPPHANKTKRVPKWWLPEALMVLKDHPDWSANKVAKEVGVSHSTLSRSDEYKRASALVRGNKTGMPRGEKDADGNMESWP